MTTTPEVPELPEPHGEHFSHASTFSGPQMNARFLAGYRAGSQGMQTVDHPSDDEIIQKAIYQSNKGVTKHLPEEFLIRFARDILAPFKGVTHPIAPEPALKDFKRVAEIVLADAIRYGGGVIDAVEYGERRQPLFDHVQKLVATLVAQPKSKSELSDAALIAAYELPRGIRVERVSQRDGTALWAVRLGSDCLGKDGIWGHEPMPSSRTEDWFDAHRFQSADEAIEAALEQTGSDNEF